MFSNLIFKFSRFTFNRAVSSITKAIERLDALTEFHLKNHADLTDKAAVHAEEADRATRVANKFRDLVA